MNFSYRQYSVIPQSTGPHHPQIVHQLLWTLSTSLGGLLRSVVLPALTQITLASVKSNENFIACPRDALFHLHYLVIRYQFSPIILSFIDATIDENLLPILRLSPQLDSLSFEDKQWTGDQVTTMESLIINTTETIHVRDALHHTLIPRLQHLEIVFQNVEFDTVSYLDIGFVEMVFRGGIHPVRKCLRASEL
ncbi:hypothetical protein IW261DRAFT_1665516 [Armillaria novae-zelandiae]|uniref:Uncharacterized protein n=1 Tax=Armillaria novae-zelandiae TaxID=153914 RepID=A0AA39NVC0_9AGAR|nr:hypothetical protein IW261DRAFT_1665516 [Armillaria novae-zelandiae]